MPQWATSAPMKRGERILEVEHPLGQSRRAHSDAVARRRLEDERGASAAQDERHGMFGEVASAKTALGRFLPLDPEHWLAVLEVQRRLRGACAAHVDREVELTRTLVERREDLRKVAAQLVRGRAFRIGR